MRSVRWLLVIGAVIAVLAGACGSDDGAEVREIDGGEQSSDSGSASGSAAASGSGSASAPASGSGSGSGSASAPVATADGGYDYASDVSSHRLVVLDVCEIATLLDADTIDYDAVATIYRDGSNSVNSDGSVRSLGGFAASEDRLHGLAEYYGTPTPLDDFVSAAIEGTGEFEGRSDAVRAQAIEKGVQNQIMVAWVVHELNTALAKAGDGELDPDEGAPHNWDEGWAFYHGAEPGCAPYATADKRAENFATTTDDGTAEANVDILAAMNTGRDALLGGDVDGAETAAADVQRAVFVTYSQAAIRYATLAVDDLAADDPATAEEHQAEGLAFWRVIEATAAANGADVDVVNAILGLDQEPAANGGGDEVRAALEPAWQALGIDAADIGELV